MSRMKAVVLFSCPLVGEFARRSDGVLFSRWWDKRGSYGYGFTKWRRANEQEQSAAAGDPEFFSYGFHSTFTKTVTDINRIRLPQE